MRFLYIILFFILPFNSYCGDSLFYQIKTFDKSQGLPENNIIDIQQSSNGSIWISSESYLIKFDGITFEIILRYSSVGFSPNMIYIDPNDVVWLIKKNNVIVNFQYTHLITNLDFYSINEKKIIARTYCSIDKGQINLINKNSINEITVYSNTGQTLVFESNGEKKLSHQSRRKFKVDDQISIEKKDSTIIIYNNNIEVNKFNELGLSSIIKHSESKYIISFNGLFGASSLINYIYDQKSNEIIRLGQSFPGYGFIYDNISSSNVNWEKYAQRTKLDPNIGSVLDGMNFSGIIHNVFVDQQNNIWIATSNSLIKNVSRNNPFNNLLQGKNISVRGINSIDSINILIASYQSPFFVNVKNDTGYKVSSFLSRNDLLAILRHKNKMYLSAHANELIEYDINSKKIVFHPFYLEEKTWEFSIVAHFNDQKCVILTSDAVLYFNYKNESFEKIQLDTLVNVAHPLNIRIIKEELILCTTTGISIIDPNGNLIISALDSFVINDIYYDESTNIYWCTSGNGLLEWNRENGSVIQHVFNSGINLNKLNTLIEDDFGFFWISTYNGLIRFDKFSKTYQVFTTKDGLSFNEFNRLSYFKSDNGNLFFGGVDGITIIDPTKFIGTKLILENTKLTFIEINKFDNTSFEAKDYVTTFEEKKELIYEENDFSYQMKVFHPDYTNLEDKKYVCEIFNIDNEQVRIYEQTSNLFNIPRLVYGKYLSKFYVKNINGQILSETLTVPFISIKPFHKKNWFWISTIALLSLLIYFYFQYRLKIIARRNRFLESEIQVRTQEIQFQKEELQKSNQAKDKLFTILAHDIKSPLISLSNISKRIKFLIDNDEVQSVLDIGDQIDEKVNRLSSFLDKLFNWALIQQNQFNYSPKNTNPVAIIEEAINLLEEVALAKNIKLNFLLDRNKNWNCYIDPTSLAIIIRNLIDNAIKFSYQNDKIDISIKENENHIVISIADHGIGINQGIANYLFKKSIKSTEGTSGEKGSGIGLSTSFEMAKKSNATLTFEANEPQGTVFLLSIPVK